MEKSEPITMVGVTESDSTTRNEVDFDRSGTITGAKVVTHKGQQYALKSFVRLISSGAETTLWRSLDSRYLAGNGQVFDIQTRLPFDKGDTLVIEAQNDNQDGFDYHHNIMVRIDYDEQLGGLLGGLL
jgi:hypothetical protein